MEVSAARGEEQREREVVHVQARVGSNPPTYAALNLSHTHKSIIVTVICNYTVPSHSLLHKTRLLRWHIDRKCGRASLTYGMKYKASRGKMCVCCMVDESNRLQ